PEPGETPTADGSGFSVPPITVAQVSFPAVVLGQPVLGAAAEVSVSGHLHLADPADSLTGALYISRIDGVAVAITSRFAYRPQADHLTLHLAAREPEGGLIVSSLALPELPEFAAAVDGEGPLDDWRATVSVAAGGKPVLSGTARLARVAGGRL